MVPKRFRLRYSEAANHTELRPSNHHRLSKNVPYHPSTLRNKDTPSSGTPLPAVQAVSGECLTPTPPQSQTSDRHTNRRPRPTPIRYTLQSKFLPSIQYVLADGLDSIENYKEAISTLHTDCVRSTLESFPDNPVLQSPAPDVLVHPGEEKLPVPTSLWL